VTCDILGSAEARLTYEESAIQLWAVLLAPGVASLFAVALFTPIGMRPRLCGAS